MSLKSVSTALAATLVLALAAPLTPAAAKEVQVTVANFTFKPQTTTIAPGDTVVFVNADDMVHTIVASDGSFRSAALDTGDRFSRTFATPGTVAYFCGMHPFMKGTIVVR